MPGAMQKSRRRHAAVLPVVRCESELERVVALRDRGAILDGEYAAVKRELLAGT